MLCPARAVQGKDASQAACCCSIKALLCHVCARVRAQGSRGVEAMA